MNKLNRHKGEEAKQYRKLKKYWKTLLKKNKHLNYTSYKQYPLFQKKYLCESDVIEQLLKTSPELRNACHVYQDLLYAFDERDFTLFFETIDHLPSVLPDDFRKKILLLQKYRKKIQNTFTHTFSNGPLEGKNNLIKVMIRLSFGFRKFSLLKARIFIQQGLYEAIK